ncbi:MAG TPA: hypothetical protein VGA37_05020 [Gemmatimonadales bacterium]
MVVAMRFSSGILSLGLLASGAPARAQTSETGWTWSVSPYVWLSNVAGLSVARGREVLVADSALIPAWAFQVEASNRRAGLRVAGTWVTVGKVGSIAQVDDPASGQPGRYDFSWATLETHGTLRIGPDNPASSFTVYLGARLVRQVMRVQTPGGEVAASQVWFEPVEGSRYAVTVGRRVLAVIAGDIGGFAVGSDFTWTLSGEVAYRIRDPVALAMRYTYREVQYDNKETGPNAYRWSTGVQQGWFFGAVLTFPRAP